MKRTTRDTRLPQPPQLPRLPVDRELPGNRHRQLKEYLMQEIELLQEAESNRPSRSSRPTPQTMPQTTRQAVPPRLRRVRPRLAYLAIPLAAAAVFAVLTVGGSNSAGTNGAGGPASPGGTSAGEISATRLLDQIASVAQSKPMPDVRDNQFVYVESKDSFEQDTLFSSGSRPVLEPLHVRQIWLSVNESQPGLLREYGRDTTLDPSTPSLNDPDYRYLQTLPTDPATLLARIYAASAEPTAGARAAEAFTTIGDLLREQIAPPAVTAALYKAAAMIPGVRVINDVVDATGTHDVAVALDNPTATNEWLFDKSSLDFEGQQTVSTKASPLGPVGTIVGTTVVLVRAIVDRAGETPAASDT